MQEMSLLHSSSFDFVLTLSHLHFLILSPGSSHIVLVLVAITTRIGSDSTLFLHGVNKITDMDPFTNFEGASQVSDMPDLRIASIQQLMT